LNIIIDVLVAEFRESMGMAIPEIIALLGHSDAGVCRAGAGTLANLSEQGKVPKFSDLNDIDVLVAEFQESIEKAIPQIIALLHNSQLIVRQAGLDALSSLSKHGEALKFLT